MCAWRITDIDGIWLNGSLELKCKGNAEAARLLAPTDGTASTNSRSTHHDVMRADCAEVSADSLDEEEGAHVRTVRQGNAGARIRASSCHSTAQHSTAQRSTTLASRATDYSSSSHL
jgi:hypothetical protein